MKKIVIKNILKLVKKEDIKREMLHPYFTQLKEKVVILFLILIYYNILSTNKKKII